jgi:hypothetical protein
MRRDIVTGLLLALAMFATRMEHFGTPVSLPDASLAVFFFAGLWLAHRSAFVLLLGVAVATDYYAFARSGVSGTCFTPAYPFLAPAYACLWVAGARARTSAANALVANTLLRPLAGALLAMVGAFAISNLSFFAFSGQFAAMPVTEYLQRTLRYAPSYVAYAALYVALGLALRTLLVNRNGAAALSTR